MNLRIIINNMNYEKQCEKIAKENKKRCDETLKNGKHSFKYHLPPRKTNWADEWIRQISIENKNTPKDIFYRSRKKQAIDYDKSFANSMSDLSINQKMR